MNLFKTMNFGVRGWILLIYQFAAFVAFAGFTGFVQNVLADLYGGAVKISMIYTSGIILAVVVQLILSAFIGKIKSIKRFGVIIGAVAMIATLGIMFVPMTMLGLWQVCFFIVTFTTAMWAAYSISILVGQWFPTKKGTFMGIVTLSCPMINGFMGPFAHRVFANGVPNVAAGFLPFWILVMIGFVLGIAFVKDYPEQCGAYRDNDKNMTPEVANAMLAKEIEDKKTSVWKTKVILTNRDYWLVTIPIGALLFCAIGMMQKTAAVIGSFGPEMDKFGGFSGIMFLVCIFGIIGSVVIGFIDSAIGTKKAILLTCVVMVISGILGLTGSAAMTFISILLIAIYMGAASNFMVSVSAQYWRREDFSNVFSTVNPVANILQAVGPTAIAIAMTASGTIGIFALILVIGIISVILISLFNGKHVKEVDDKLRLKAGKPIDDALVGRK